MDQILPLALREGFVYESLEQEERMPRADKVAKVNWIREKFAAHPVVFLTDFKGLTVDEINGLRFSLRDKGADYRVLKNTLALLAIKDTDYQSLERFFEGPVAAAFTSGDPIQVARGLVNYSRKNPNLKIKGGYMEGRVLEPQQIKDIAVLASREALIAKLVGTLGSPISGLHGALSGITRKLVYTLSAVAGSKSEAA